LDWIKSGNAIAATIKIKATTARSSAIEDPHAKAVLPQLVARFKSDSAILSCRSTLPVLIAFSASKKKGRKRFASSPGKQALSIS
jgi:hypothetical protein